MIVRMTWGKLQPDSWDEFEGIWRSFATGSGSGSKGLKYRELLRKVGDPTEGVAMSVWDTEEDLIAYENGEAVKSVLQQMEHLWTGEYEIKHYEVRGRIPGE